MVLYSPHGSSNLLDPEAKQQRDDASVPVQHSIQNDNSVINPCLLRAEYAVRGPITDRAAQIERELATGTHNHDFQKLLYCNIGNPQALGQVPISYGRRLLALCECPELMGSDVSPFFPEDVIAFAKNLKEKIKIGAYTASLGHPELRKMIAAGIEKRDGHEASIDTPQEYVVLSNGASASVHYLLQAMIQDSSDAFLVPVPQYPLYSAALSLYGGALIPYYLDEASGWGVDVDSVEQLIRDSMAKGLRVRGLVVINPGNPTGQVLSQENQRKVVQMCGKMGVPIIADEVYQDNIWASDKTFTSFRKIVLDEFEHLSPVVFSLHSTSKGYLGECGHRGGYMNILNCPPELLTQLSKLMSISLCSNTPGQILMAAMMNPPEPGKPSYQEFNSQKSAILQSLARRAAKLAKGLRALEGVTCCEPEGALYVFPKLTIPENAKAKALAKDVQPDFMYCLELLEATGIVSVPGSGFGQVEGTFHVRLTILPSEEDIDAMLDLLTRFHASFMAKYSHTAAV